MSEPLPEVRPIRVVHYDHTRIVTISCPFCRHDHTHGWPYSDDNRAPGTRVAHCVSDQPRGTYRILAPGGRP